MVEDKDTVSRTLFLKGDIDSEAVCDLIEKIYKINEYDSEYSELLNGFVVEPIKLIINTQGGSAYDSLALVDVIRGSATPIHTICLNAFSAGFIILIAGHRRFAYSNSTMIYHQPQLDLMPDSLRKIEQEIEESNRVYNIIKDIIISETNITSEELDNVEKENKEWFIDTKTALGKGIIDDVL